jgi:hypothetical protein
VAARAGSSNCCPSSQRSCAWVQALATAAPDPAVAQQELRQPVPRPGPVFDHVGTGAAQVPHGFLPDGRDADGDQLAGAVQPRQPAAVPRIGLDPIPRCDRDQRRRDHLAADAHVGKQPGQLEPGGAGLVAGSQPAGIAEAANEPAHRRLVVGNPVDLGDLLVRGQDRHRDRVAVHVQA